MDINQEYKLFKFQDYGPLGTKEHIRLLRNTQTGEICVKKILDYTQKGVMEFLQDNPSPYFPKVYEFFEEQDHYIVIEEYISGVTLSEYMAGSPLTEQETLRIARQICLALLALHRAKPVIVYRDLKAENVMITPSGDVKLVDFNISRQVQEGKNRDTALLGTPEYAAPEQFGYFQTDNRTDIYAFGVLLNYMLTGHFPVDGISSGKLRHIIQKCIEMEPSKRYQTIEEILCELGSSKNIPLPSMNASASWALPGFRNNTLWKQMLAAFGYLFLLYMGLTITFSTSEGTPYTPAMQWITRIAFSIANLATILFCGNYRGLAADISFYKHPFHMIRIVSYGITWLIFVSAMVIASGVVQTIFHL